MKHANCGGEIKVDHNTAAYLHTDDDGRPYTVPAYRCQKCWREILATQEPPNE